MRENVPGRLLNSLRSLHTSALRYFLCSLFFSYFSFQAVSQQVVFSESFDNSTATQPWAPYYSSGWFSSAPLNTIQSQSGRGNVLRVNFPAGTVGSASGIGNYRIPLDSAYKELYLSWEYYVPTYFDYGWGDTKGGGKFFGGFAGGSMPMIPNNDDTELDGWGSILMFQNGFLSTYNYFKGTTYTNEGWPLGSRVADIIEGEWRRITIRMKVNDGNQANGLFEVFDNDVLCFQQNNIRIVNGLHPEYLIEHIYLNSFFGGYGAEYTSPINQYMEFDNLVAFYYPSGTSGYRAGASEAGRRLSVPAAGSHHPLPPNRFHPSVYTESSGTITSHCAFFQPVNHPGFETSTIEVNGATQISINVTRFDYDKGLTSPESAQILKIYQGKGSGRTLVRTFQNLVNTTPSSITVSGSTATIEWQAGMGLHGGFSLNYYSNGTGSGKNFSCDNYVATQGGVPLVVPSVPTSLEIIRTGDHNIELRWADNSDNEDWFEIERRGPNSTTVVHMLKSSANSTTLSDAGLQSNSAYIYRIRAYNALSGASAWTSQIEAKTTMPVPSSPGGLTLRSATVNSITIGWNDNSDNEDKFVIERTGPGNSDLTQVIECNANTTTYIDNGLVANSSYTYRIRAYSSVSGYSTYSPLLTARTILPPPATPEALTIKKLSVDTVVIKWTDKSFGETNFELERRGPDGSGNVKTMVCEANSTEYADVQVEWSSVYTYRVRAFNSISGYSSWSNQLQVQTLRPPVPNAPSELQGKSFTNESITIQWKDNSHDEKGFVVTRSMALDNGNSTTFSIDANDTLFTDTGLLPNQSYVYAVKAVNDMGSSPFSNQKIATTLSVAETKRVSKDLVAYYNFNFIPDNMVYDLSGYSSPLNLNVPQPSYVSWDEHKKLTILSSTEIVSEAPATKIVKAVKQTGEITVECWVKPNEPSYSGESRLISIGEDETNTGFVLNQQFGIENEKKTLKYSARFQTESTNEAGYPVISQESHCESVDMLHIVYRHESDGNEALFVNGKKAATGFRASGLQSWNDDYMLRIGNEKDLSKGFLGTFYSVAVYSRSLTNDEIQTNYAVHACDSLRSSISIRVSVFPNPATDEAYIEIEPQNTTDYSPFTLIRLMDVTGTVVFQLPVFNPNERFSQLLDLRNYKRGIYFLQVISGNSQQSNKIILQ